MGPFQNVILTKTTSRDITHGAKHVKQLSGSIVEVTKANDTVQLTRY